jgi:peptide/nickel transport system permease protein
MIRFLLTRLAGALLTLLALSFIIFALIGLMPGDPADLLTTANPDATPADVALLRALYGVDQPILMRYWHWLEAAAHGNFGYSRMESRPVMEIVIPAIGNTVALMGTAFVVSTLIAVALGTLAAMHKGRPLDRAINLFAYAGISVPSFWLGLVLIYVFAVRLGLLPAGGMPQHDEGFGAGLAHFILPVTALVIVETGGLTRYARAAMIEVLGQDYIRTARAKGVSEGRMILRHALRNAMVPVITIIALGFGYLFSGALLIESLFAWRGMGRLILDAIMGNDYNLALVCLLFTTAMILLANIGADLAYSWLDPRISLQIGRAPKKPLRADGGRP